MSKEDLRREVQECVKQHGPEKAREILYARLGTDPEFKLATAKYGFELLQAIKEAEESTVH